MNTKFATATLVMCLMFGSAITASAAGTYTLTCESERGAALNIALTGFKLNVTSSGESAPTGAALGRRSNKLALSIRFAPGHDYQTLLSIAEDGEMLRSCKLIDGEVSGTSTAKDGWTAQMGATNGKVKKGNAPPAPSTGGALEWILTNATVTGVTAVGEESNTGVPAGSIEATIEAQNFSFAM